MAQVTLRNITKAWGTTVAVNNINLDIDDSEFVAVLGPSGCGKSTLLFMLSGVYMPTAGEILFDSAKVNDVEARHRNVGIVFQSYALYPNMSVLQNIQFPLRFQDVPDKHSVAQEMAELVQVGDLLDRKPNQLSGGQQQRVALARALVKRPNLLLLDEPLSNLDATLRLTMRAEIRRITRELGVTTILVTHDQLEATTMSDRVVCMNTGQIEQIGLAEDLYLRPDTLFVAGFIGSPPINLIEGHASNGKFSSADGELELLSDDALNGALTVGFRPELVRVSKRGGLPGRVVHIEPMGREVLTTAETPLGIFRFLEATATPLWHAGDDIHLTFEASDSIVFDNRGSRLSDVTARLPG